MKYNYYIGVQTGDGSKVNLVTQIYHGDKSCMWHDDEKPLKVALSVAKDIVFGLCVNGYRAFVITTIEEYEKQPFVSYKKQEQV